MKSTLQTLSIAAGLALVAPAITAAPAQAVNLFEFTVNIDSGPLNGDSFSGSFGFDNPQLDSFGDGTADLTSFSFNARGRSFGLNDATDTPFAEFFDGDFLGIDYAFSRGSTNFQFRPGFFSIDGATFDYEIRQGSGFGDTDFDRIPTPALLPGLIGMGIATIRRKRQAEQEK